MFRSPSQRNAGKGVQSSPIKKKNGDGLYKDGIWYCDCKPRRCAQMRTARKDNENYGRKFWGCSLKPAEPKACNLFIWEDDALRREDEEVSSTQSPSKIKVTPRSNGRPASGQASPSKSMNMSMSMSMRQTTLTEDEFSDTETDEDIDEDEDEDVGTPKKKRKTSSATPQIPPTKRVVVDSETNNIFDTPAANRDTAALFKRPSTPPPKSLERNPRSYPATPQRTPKRKFDDAGLDIPLDLTSEVLSLLDTARDVILPNNVRTELHEMLKRHSLQKDGYYLGRERVRQALERKTEQNKKLQQENQVLESEKQALRERVRALEANVDNLSLQLQATTLSPRLSD